MSTPKPSLSGPRRGSRARATTEQLAKILTDRRPSAPGQPDKAVIRLRLLLPRVLLERLVVRAIQEDVPLEAVVEEMLGREGT